MSLCSFASSNIVLLIGAARQTVTTTLDEFRDQGIIDFNRKEMVIKQMERLKSIAT
jgi:hypothetical protein